MEKKRASLDPTSRVRKFGMDSPSPPELENVFFCLFSLHQAKGRHLKAVVQHFQIKSSLFPQYELLYGVPGLVFVALV